MVPDIRFRSVKIQRNELLEMYAVFIARTCNPSVTMVKFVILADVDQTAPLSDLEYLHADERGSIVAVTDDTGPVESHQYDVYGVPLDQSDSLFRYT